MTEDKKDGSRAPKTEPASGTVNNEMVLKDDIPYADKITAIRKYTAKGWVVHPLSKPDDKGNSPGKKPLLANWQKLTATPPDIETHIKNGCNIGLVCGKASGIAVIDLDSMLFADDLFREDTLKCQRVDGKGHIYFKYNPNLLASKHHDLGIEILSDGSNAVLPPSIHKSGDVYRWINPDAPIIEMSKELEKYLLKLFQTEAELKQILSKCRHCFKTVLKRRDVVDWHGAEGREYMIAVCTDLKANGATEEHIKMFARLVYGFDYNEQQTLQEWRNIDPTKTWTCDTLKAKLPAYVYLAECAECDKRRQKEHAGSEKQDSQASALIKYVEAEDIELFHDENHSTYTRIRLEDGHNAIFPTKGSEFRRWLANKYYIDTQSAPGSDAINNAMNVIEAKASYGGQEHKLHNRICWHDGAIWYDLGNWEAVKITSQGWEWVKNPPILFQHFRHQSAGGCAQMMGGTSQNAQSSDVSKVLNFVNIQDEKERVLFVVYLVSCFVPDIPHPIPVLHGEKGAAKSTLFKIIKELVDPSTLRLATFPKDNNELVQRLAHHYFVGFDNVSTLSDWQSDALCRAVTGEGFSKRALYTDDEDIIYNYQRCIGLNGINVVATKADLLDRSILLRLERIPKKERKTEAQLWRAFDVVKDEILSGIFTATSSALAIHPSIKLDELPRMADFTIWGCAIAEALGYGKDVFLEAYSSNIQAQNREAIEGSPVGELILKFMEDQQEWEGRASELLTLLEGLADVNKVNIKAKSFPKAANVVVRRLNEIKTNLMDEGIFFETSHSTDRTIRVWKNTVRTVLSSESQAVEHEKKDDTKDDNKTKYRPKEPELKKDDIRTIPKSEPSYISSEKNQEQETKQDDKDAKDGISRPNLEEGSNIPLKSLVSNIRAELITQAKHFPEGTNEALIWNQAYRWDGATEERIKAAIDHLIQMGDIQVLKEKDNIRYIKWIGG